jgi:hypothetical protein
MRHVGRTEFGTVMPAYDALPEQVDSAIQDLSEDNWEVKSVTPILETYFVSAVLQNTEDMLGLVKSNAGSQTVTGTYTAGVIIFAQRWRELSEAEASERQRRKSAKLEAEEALRASEAEEQRRNAGPIAHGKVMNMPIERVGGIMSSKWAFNGQEYHTEGMAKRARQEMAEQAKSEAERNARS